jgi:hypothetical protein
MIANRDVNTQVGWHHVISGAEHQGGLVTAKPHRVGDSLWASDGNSTTSMHFAFERVSSRWARGPKNSRCQLTVVPTEVGLHTFMGPPST